MSFRRAFALAPLPLALAIAGCGHGRGEAPQPIPAAPKSPVDTVDGVVAALQKGDEAGARRQLKVLLKHEPSDPSAHVLLESLDRDPVELLGPKHFDYVTQPGDTMSGLAERFLGNRLKFYQLARYNGITAPAALVPGTTLKIPGEPPHAAPPPERHEEEAAPRRSETRPSEPKAAPAPAKPAAPAANPVAAAKLRRLGLTALNQGQVDRAVLLLRHAAALDPKNPLIARDLDRAERIARTVHAHR